MMFIKYHWKNFITVNAVYLLSRAIIREKKPRTITLSIARREYIISKLYYFMFISQFSCIMSACSMNALFYFDLLMVNIP